MSNQDLEKLRQAVRHDARLEKDLQTISDRADFVRRAVEVAAKLNLNVSAEIIAEAMRESRREWIERWI